MLCCCHHVQTNLAYSIIPTSPHKEWMTDKGAHSANKLISHPACLEVKDKGRKTNMHAHGNFSSLAKGLTLCSLIVWSVDLLFIVTGLHINLCRCTNCSLHSDVFVHIEKQCQTTATVSDGLNSPVWFLPQLKNRIKRYCKTSMTRPSETLPLTTINLRNHRPHVHPPFTTSHSYNVSFLFHESPFSCPLLPSSSLPVLLHDPAGPRGMQVNCFSPLLLIFYISPSTIQVIPLKWDRKYNVRKTKIMKDSLVFSSFIIFFPLVLVQADPELSLFSPLWVFFSFFH